MATRFICDTNCELWYTDIEELGIDYIKMPYILDGQVYDYDFGKDTDFKTFYNRIREGATPTTSALNEYTYTEIFEPIFQAGDDIFYMSFSQEMSATFNFMDSAVKALLEKYPERKFKRFDTSAISMGAGIQVYYAMKLHNEGKSDEEVLTFLEEFTKHISTVYAVDNLYHLKRGGRISAVAAALGTLIQLKPMVGIKDSGKLEVVAKVKGPIVYKHFAEQFKIHARELDKYDVWILHGDCEDRALKLKARLVEMSEGKANIRISYVGPVIGAHCGADTLGLVYYADKRAAQDE